MNNIDIAVWADKSQRLLQKAHKTYSDLKIANDTIPESAFDKNNPVSLVFAGQYSAGKSTILKALTGINDIVVKEGIATLETHEYEWNGMTVIDTPGIGTQLRPDHDQIALNAITNADMLIYVVTHNLFDDIIGSEFRNLIIDKDKAKETILIVNKMADVGNDEETRAIKLESLREVTFPYSPEDLRTCFVDAESYIDSKTETDEEYSAVLLERSNYTELVNTINTFVSEKALVGRLTTSLYRAIEVIQSSLKEYLPSSGDDDIDALEEVKLREKSILSKTIRSIEAEVKQKYKAASEKIREAGRNLADSCDTFSSQADADDACKKAQDEVNEISENCSKEVEESINSILAEYSQEMDEFYSSPFTKKLYNRLKVKDFKDHPVIKKIVDKELLSKSGAFIVNNSGGVGHGLKGLSGFSGTNVHQVVLDVGHFLGHSFKPWEAVKIAKGINIAGKVIGVAGTLFTIAVQAKEDYDTEKRVQEQRKNREEIRATFNSTAEELESYFACSLSEMIETELQPKMEELEITIQDIRQLRADKSDKCKCLINLEEEFRQLIRDIHKSNVCED